MELKLSSSLYKKNTCGTVCVTIVSRLIVFVLFNICQTYILILFADVTFSFYICAEWPLKTQIASLLSFNLTAVLALWSHLSCMLLNPGIVPRNISEDKKQQRAIPAGFGVYCQKKIKIFSKKNNDCCQLLLSTFIKRNVASRFTEIAMPLFKANTSNKSCIALQRQQHWSKLFSKILICIFGNITEDPHILKESIDSFTKRNQSRESSLSLHFKRPLVLHNNNHHIENTLTDSSLAKKLNSHWCNTCQHEKPPHTHHCSVCQCCIVRMDHHCPWVNNCIGINNQKHFLLFLCYVSLLSFFTVLGVFIRVGICLVETSVLLQCDHNKNFDVSSSIAALSVSSKSFSLNPHFLQPSQHLNTFSGTNQNQLLNIDDSHNASSIHENTLQSLYQITHSTKICNFNIISITCFLIAFLEGIIFGLFTFIMACDQFATITNNSTRVDILKKKPLSRRSIFTGLIHVFGSPFSFRWLLPLPQDRLAQYKH